MNSDNPANLSGSSESILLTFDVEDWFHVENLKPWIPFASWDSLELRVEKNTQQILDLLDSVGQSRQARTPKDSGSRGDGGVLSPGTIKGTFFILGWVAKRLPSLVRDIQARGHEVASHGFYHQLCYHSSREELKRDLEDSKSLLEDILGQQVHGYRAPSFSVTEDVLKLVKECGYGYDSSVNSFKGNGRYGRVDFNGAPRKGMAVQCAENFFELPISNLQRGSIKIPVGGGGYFRLMPFSLFAGLASFLVRKEGAYMFYFHPWELDPGQPKVKESCGLLRFRHYYNINRGKTKLKRLVEYFPTCKFVTCKEYLELQNFHQQSTACQ